MFFTDMLNGYDKCGVKKMTTLPLVLLLRYFLVMDVAMIFCPYRVYCVT